MPMAGQRGYYGVGPIFGLASLLWFAAMAAGHLVWRPRFVVELVPPWPARVCGAVLAAAGWTLYALAVRQVRRALRADTLATGGLYRFVRHPVYAVHVFLTVPGLALMARSWLLLTTPVFMYVVLRVLVRREEALLAEQFGPAWREYKRRVPALFPRPWR
jgi:protein-S-isoprenylcysteine O-methyltransferase Ste14